MIQFPMGLSKSNYKDTTIKRRVTKKKQQQQQKNNIEQYPK